MVILLLKHLVWQIHYLNAFVEVTVLIVSGSPQEWYYHCYCYCCCHYSSSFFLSRPIFPKLTPGSARSSKGFPQNLLMVQDFFQAECPPTIQTTTSKHIREKHNRRNDSKTQTYKQETELIMHAELFVCLLALEGWREVLQPSFEVTRSL